jgi:hypothetical protein
LRFKDRPTIVGWMHGDEPDNAQSLGSGKGYGPPIPPATIVEGYDKIRKADPDRPVLLNLGQGVARDGWPKRHDGRTYLSSVAMREGETTATFTLPGTGDARVEVLGEGRTIQAVDGRWEDRFTVDQVHLYKISPRGSE